MGIRVRIGSLDYEPSEYGVSEGSSPVAITDSSGAVGSLDISFPIPSNPDHPINKYTAGWLEGQEVSFIDTNYGTTVGRVFSANTDPASQLVSVSITSRLGNMNVYGIQAEPFVGTLGDAFTYYASLAGETVGVLVDESIASREVLFPGFNGELWYYLKQMASAQDCDITLVSNVILLRPIRTREAVRGRTITVAGSVGGGSLAQAVEVYWYDSKAITNKLVYPAGGWTPETEVLNVNAGETAEYQLELSASLSSIQAPTMQTFVSDTYSAASVYTIVRDDGLPVDPAYWAAQGGKVEISLNPDTISLTVKLTGATNIQMTGGAVSAAFSLALRSNSGSYYSTLRIVGTGVSYTKEKKRIRTGVPASRTATDVGITIDNPFITSLNGLYSAGTRAAKQYTGISPTLAGSVTRVNRRGEDGQASVLNYGTAKDLLAIVIGGTPTYGDVQTQYVSDWSLPQYGNVQSFWADNTASDFNNQAFGNVGGARVWDQATRRYYRIRSATIAPGEVSFSQADDDLTQGDVEAFYSSTTYGDLQVLRDELTYQQERLVGLSG